MNRKRSRLAWGLALGLVASLGWAPWAHAAGGKKSAASAPVSDAASITPAAAAPEAGSAPAASGASASSGTPGASDLNALKDEVDQLNQKILVLERKGEIEKEEKATKAKETPTIAYKDGFVLSSGDGQYQLKLNGWLAYDTDFFSDTGDLKRVYGKEFDGTGFNSARINLSGKITDFIEWKTEYEFAGETGADTPSFKDAYIQFNEIPYLPGLKGQLRVGQFREPFGMDEITSSRRSRTFMEQPLTAVFDPAYNPGIMWSDALFGEPGKERLTYELGIFKTADDWPSSNDNAARGYGETIRVTGLPYESEDGTSLLHVGLAYSHRNPNGQVLGWNARSESRLLVNRYANLDATAPAFPPAPYRLRDARAENVDEFDAELAYSRGPLLLQGEYLWTDVKTTYAGSRNFGGWYAQAAYLLTGESRPFKNAQGLFDRIRPKHNFGIGEGKGWGAWELAARYSTIDLTDGPVRGGKQSDAVFGVNWYLNPQAKIQFNYVHNWVENAPLHGQFDIFETRFFIDF